MAISEWSIRRTNIGQSEVKVVLCDDDAEFLNIFRGEIIEVFKKLNLKAELTTFNSAEYIPDGMFASCDMVFLDIDFEGEDYNKQTGIDQVINTPLESLSVNLPLGSTITCNAYHDYVKVNSADVFIANNSGEGVYEDEFLTSVNDYTWNH